MFTMTMAEAIQEFGFDCKIRKLSPKTIANYQKQVKYLQRYLGNELGVTEVEAIKSNQRETICKYLAAWIPWDDKL